MANIFNYKDIISTVKSFLNNNEIIELISCSKNLENIIGKTNVFTSITVNNYNNICDTIRLYLQHKISITKIIIVEIPNPINLWPFDSNTMIFIDCNVDDNYVKKNYNTNNTKIITKKRARFWH
jgi:hypothetical protein